MVKGRRTRQTNSTTVSSNATHDDTASPRRKDFKYDSTSSVSSNSSMLLRGGKSKSPTITKYLTSCLQKPKPECQLVKQVVENFIDLTDENTCDAFENTANGIANTSSLTTSDLQCFSVVKSQPSSNIFLQEPVLSLNFDKTPNEKSRMVIRHSFLSTDIQTKFSPEFPSIKCEPDWNNAKDAAEYALDLSKPTQVTEIDSTTFSYSDSSNSCDSGVVLIPSINVPLVSPGHSKRKPATPHRIVCPSPVKVPIVASPSTALAHLNIEKRGKRNLRSKRRLNTKELENALDDAEDKQNKDAADKSKLVLNTLINPTAQQNTHNNNKVAVRTETNKKLTDFFPVRRSVRKTKKEVIDERNRDIEKAIREEREDGLKVIQNFEEKGRGIVSTRPFAKGEFVVEYIGDLITVNEAKEREAIYAEDDSTGCYMYYFKHKNVQHCIDATAESGKLGRLVNHSRNGNLMTKTISINNRPHLVLIAKEDIAAEVEVTYDYGDRSKESLQYHPWLAL